MRLIECYVENFGCLSGYTLKFCEGLTVINEPNGFGKSTLAAFIKAMFYGFPKSVRSLDKNERKLYMPWNGGNFGGSLSFEHEGIKYRIERFFAAVPRQDKFMLYELEPFQESRRFGENIGVEIFGLDAESYEKSTYMPQIRVNGAFATTGIQAKLSDLVEENDDIYNFDKAYSILREKRIFFLPYRGNGGRINALRSEISRLQCRLAEKSGYKSSYENLLKKESMLYESLNASRTRLYSLQKKTVSGDDTFILEMRKRYETIREESEKKKSSIKKVLLSVAFVFAVAAFLMIVLKEFMLVGLLAGMAILSVISIAALQSVFEKRSLKASDEMNMQLSAYKDEQISKLKNATAVENGIREEINNIRELISNTKYQLSELKARLDDFNQIEDELTHAQMELKANSDTCSLLDKTMGFLQESKESLIKSQVNPIKKSFEKYLNKLLVEKSFSVFIDKELNIMPECLGEARNLTYFSAGYKDIVRLCMHLALTEVLFETGDGILVLDDPFINLDDEKMTIAMDLLRQLSKERQILYMTCHSSRG